MWEIRSETLPVMCYGVACHRCLILSPMRVLLQYWMMYFLFILGPAFLLCGCLLLTLESSDPWWEGE